MAKLEIPSIVVESGSLPPSAMEHTASKRTQWSRSCKNSNEEELDTSDSSDIEKPKSLSRMSLGKRDTTTSNGPLPRSKTKPNMKLLTRSFAIMESTSPPPDRSLSPVNCPSSLISSTENLAITNNNNNNVTVNNNSNGSLENSEEHSNQGSENNSSANISLGNSIEQSQPASMDQSGGDLEQFIIDTLNKNTKDRQFLMRLESDLVNFAKDSKKPSIKFGAMSSYQRMLVHRVAHYFGMEHNVDASGQMVIVNKGKNTRLPDTKFAHFLRDDLPMSEEPRRSILKRDSASFEDTTTFKSSHRHDAETLRRSKSYEEREEEYEKARRRIFHQEHGYSNQNSHDIEDGYHDDPQGWISHVWLTPESEDSSKLHPNSNRGSRLKKVESYESKDTLKANSLRSSISKSYSFGGYDQNAQNNRVLIKQDSGSSMGSRVSPLSSGYKSQSLRSDTMSATPSPTATPHLTRQLSNQSAASPEPEQPTVVWAVTNMGSVPAGSVLIDPQSGEPFTNEDGSIYHFDPDNPPTFDGRVIESASRSRYHNGAEQSSVVHDHERNGRMEHQTNIPSKELHPHVGLANQADMNAQHQNYQNHSQPPPPPMPTVPPPAPIFAPGLSQVYSQPQQPPYNYGIGVPRYSQEGNSQDLSGYMMGLSLSDTERMNPSQPHQMCFCNPAHTTTHPSAVPMPQTVVYTPLSTSTIMPRGNDGPTIHRVVYNTGGVSMPMMFAPPPPFPPSIPPAQAAPYLYKYAQNPSQSERSGAECTFAQQSGTPVHTFYRIPPIPPNPQLGAQSFFTSTTNGMPQNCMMGYMQMPSAAPIPPAPPSRIYHQRMATPPNTSQNGCTQFPVFSSNYGAPMQSCYPHYQAGNVPLTPVLRPALPLSISNSPPRVAPQFNGPARPSVHEQSNRSRNDNNHYNNPQHSFRPSVYQFGNPEVILMNNSRRSANVQSPGSSMRRRTRS